MMLFLTYLVLVAPVVRSLIFESDQVGFNLNENRTAVNPVDYWGEWQNHIYQESPSNWRFPIYTLVLDKFVNGDPSNDNANGTVFEQDVMGNQLRFGGDLAGLVDTLDYIQGMGVKGLYIAGTPLINMPWGADGYSPLDFSLLDRHFGDIDDWRAAVTEIHKRGMYVILDNTLSTMGDLIGFDGYLNTSTPFSPTEHKALWKTDQRYPDFTFDNTYQEECIYPTFWNESGYPVLKDSDPTFSQLNGCYDSDFDQYGDTEAFGFFPDWQRQLSKFASVQDRLREWKPSVLEKLERFSCITIAMLDIDGFRFDKATQVTVDAHANFTEYIRDCARNLGKNNFFISGEITGGNTFGSIYLGRGRQPNNYPDNLTQAITLTNASSNKYFLRDQGKSALDAAAFHYSFYRSLTRFLGMDGQLAAGYDVPVNFVDAWNTMLTSNDLINANTGVFDPRHMFGVENQDVFRWSAITMGTQRMLLGLYLATLQMPGIPLLLWGEEQASYILDNTANNYLFGRQPIASSVAWQNHGCYRLGSSQYYNFPLDAALNGCNDDSVSLDHRDPSHPVRNIIKSMYYLRSNYPVLNDGYFLQSLSNQTHQIFLPGSNGTATDIGLWSVLRDQWLDAQNFTDGQSVWLVYQNDNQTINYSFDCKSNDTALISPFDAGTTVKNLLYPYEEVKLKDSPKKLGIDFSENFNGCLDNLKLDAYAFKAYVPVAKWVAPPPMLTKFVPGHDARIETKAGSNGTETVDIELQFSEAMNCDQITKFLIVNSTVVGGVKAKVDETTVSCGNITNPSSIPYAAGIPSAWSWKATLVDVSNGIHSLTIQNVTGADGDRWTDSVDRLQFRIGKTDNPIVFPRLANYSTDVLSGDSTGKLTVSHKAAGAEKWRYSLNWGSFWSNWTDYEGGNSTLAEQPWTGTSLQKWQGDHVILQYWSRLAGSSDSIQHADAQWAEKPPRRFPHLFANGPWNLFGYDAGINNQFQQDANGTWNYHLMTEWPSELQVNVWGMNSDGQPDQTFVFGDIDNDNVLDRLPPNYSGSIVVNFTALPPSPYLAYRMELNDGDFRFKLIPAGNRIQQILLFALLWAIPILTGLISVWTYMGAFYGVKFNKIGNAKKKGFFPFTFHRGFEKIANDEEKGNRHLSSRSSDSPPDTSAFFHTGVMGANVGAVINEKRRTVLIATMEYDIEDWAIKIKIGGLGVMAQLMGKNLSHQDLIWVVPCVGGVEYPVDQVAEPMSITVLGAVYQIEVQYHKLNNITYVLLDAPVFRQQTKSEPYPPRMDDLDSAIYYSAWNACIAQAIERFPVDIYHINDYHGAAAPLYLLPKTIPCCLSLHNAEFQGLWPMRTVEEKREVCDVFNLDPVVVKKYIQFGEVFNLLHAGASYLRVHQKGFGAVGVSNKYGERSYSRYPIFWGLKEIGKLPNPDPSDTEPWGGKAEIKELITVDPQYEASRGEFRRQAQEWAGLNIDPTAELFVFVGRWSNQKGVDLIADVFPAILEKHSRVQLMCIGPVIDLYGRFAAGKLEKIMQSYPKRVFSKPEFTQLPPYVFTGAEFALIPSRDEPFGLVAVEFGRKGALGVGARVGGLGQMPGWWFTVESTTTKHLHHQFKSAIEEALASKTETRAMMRAHSAKQRFPVAKWVEDLDTLQSNSIRIHCEVSSHGSRNWRSRLAFPRGFLEPHCRNVSTEGLSLFFDNGSHSHITPPGGTPRSSQSPNPQSSPGLSRKLSLGVRNGPGHTPQRMTRVDDDSPEAPLIEETDSGYDTRDSSQSGEYTLTREEAEDIMREGQRRDASRQPWGAAASPSRTRQSEDTINRGRSAVRVSSNTLSVDLGNEWGKSPANGSLLTVHPPPTAGSGLTSSSVLSLHQVVGSRSDYKLQQVDPTFNDTTGEYYREFERRLSNLDGKTSEGALCIEEYLVNSEKAWFKKMCEAKLSRSRGASPNPSFQFSRDASPTPSFSEADGFRSSADVSDADEFLIRKDYKRPSFVKRSMQRRIGDWPVYSLFLALGQIIAANSYQITLLTGGQSETPQKLYILGSIYFLTSCLWWIMFRTLKSRYALSVPFIFYGLSFLFVGISPFVPMGAERNGLRDVAAGMYITASSSGFLFFALNFGDEGGAPIKSWIYRACLIQGTQQIYITSLFYWGNTMTTKDQSGTTTFTSKPIIAAVTLPIATLLWLIGLALFTSLPPYYRQSPGKIPNFYKTLFRRKIVGWMFIAVVLQNYFLSTPYGRNWGYLWSSKYAPAWAVGVLVVLFFVILWAAILYVFSQLSKSHSWILPIFAIGLGAPRWAQMLWGTSGIGPWVPWMPGGPVAAALAGRVLWLWLGVLDSIQGIGFGMMLLQTLTRVHIAVSLLAAQLLGTGITMLAKATAPDKDGPGDVFPDFSAGILQGISKSWFWIALAAQLVIPIGFFKFFRKEQLSKP